MKYLTEEEIEENRGKLVPARSMERILLRIGLQTSYPTMEQPLQ